MTDRSSDRSYRARVYESYVSKGQRPDATNQEQAYQSWSESAQIRFAGWLPPDRSAPILDLGCGHGNCLYLLERLGYTNLTGVDLSSQQLLLATRYAPTAVLVHDDIIRYLSSCSEQFELIVCLSVIEHLCKTEIFEFLDLLVCALVPGGRAVFETPNAESPWFGAVAYGDHTHEWFFTPRELADLLGRVGLTNAEARPSGPMRRTGKALVRRLIWYIIRQSLILWNLAETGSAGSGIYTRVFAISAVKPGAS